MSLDYRKEINIKNLKMAENHPRIVYMRHAFINGSKFFHYLNFDEKKFVLDRIKEVVEIKCNNNSLERKKIRANEKAMVETQKK